MNPLRKQRLYALIAVLIGSLLATWLVVSALSENMNLFYSPSEILEVDIDENVLIRAGGMVKQGSIEKSKDSLNVRFTVTDYQNVTKHWVAPRRGRPKARASAGARVLRHACPKTRAS